MAAHSKGAEFIGLARIAVTAIAADDELQPRLVLKGGTAIQLIHRVGFRSSKDIDFSRSEESGAEMSDEALKSRLDNALRSRFDAHGYDCFDFRFERRGDPIFGGYEVLLRVVQRGVVEKKAKELAGRARPRTRPDLKQQLSTEIKIEVSNRENVAGNVARELEGYEVRVYTPAMIVAEKLRALCQQMPGLRKRQASRARDFYDIHALITGSTKVNIASDEGKALVRAMFDAKNVPLTLLGQLAQMREHHRTTWEGVRMTVVGENLGEFDSYFDFVLAEVAKLDSFWVSDSPA